MSRFIGTDEETVGSLTATYRLSKDVMWDIDNFEGLPSNQEYIASTPVFQFQSQEWRVWIWPNYRPEYILLNLMRKGSLPVSPCRIAKFTVGLKRADGTIHTIETKSFGLNGECPRWRCASISYQLKQSQLLKERDTLLADGRLSLYFRLSVDGETLSNEVSTQTEIPRIDPEKETESEDSKEEEDIPKTEALYILARNLKDLYISRNDSDVNIKVITETFPAHRSILGARSPVLAAMFSHIMSEAETGEVNMDDCEPKAVEIFLLFVYSGILKNLSEDNVLSVYYIADKYDLPDLKEECVQFMLDSLTIDSVCNIIKTAAQHDEKQMLDKACEFFQENSLKIFSTTMWERFMVENPTLAQDLIVGSFKYASEK